MTPPSSANFKKIAENHLRDQVNTINDMFKTRIDRATAVLGSKVNDYNHGRQLLIDNVEHCTDDITGLSKDINDDKIGDNYHELIEKYGRYKTDSESLYNQYISNPVDTIIDTDIDQLEQQDATRKLFQTLQDSCRGIVGFITQNMSEIDVEVEAFNTLVDEYS